MLSYQHIFHAGNLADVHKHALLAWVLDYLTRKDKPLSYLETHSGRALYQLDAPEALKTGEAAQGIGKVAEWFADHPYGRALDQIRAAHGETAYPGSPMIAGQILRAGDSMHLAELHPQEFTALRFAMAPYSAHCHKRDGFEMAQALCPPTPRRGMLLIDPSYEIKTDYQTLPKVIGQIHRKWNVGVLALWYPILTSGAQAAMVRALKAANLPGAVCHEVHFPPARKGHGMVGSGMFFVNAPWGLDDECASLTKRFG